ncbi:MAG: sigma-70 family RNA polymerase sigma factor [Gaiellales bacterium]|nr:sigma-70 family RNA polymerase sigma factor [Gaiellales bacterium]
MSHTPEPPSDELLVERARAGEGQAVAELYRRHEQKAYNLALRMMGDSWDAADVTQEAFIKAFAALDQFRGEARFGTWLHRIVVNAVRDHLRKRRLDPMENDDLDRACAPGETGAAGRLVGGRQSRLDPAADGLSPPLVDALLLLDERFRLAVVLCDLLGYEYSEAAEILGVQEGTIKSRIFRARAELAQALRAAGYGPAGGRSSTSGAGVDTPGTPRAAQPSNGRSTGEERPPS